MIIITGMHRSGTSFSANMLYELDLTFGEPQMLMPADQWNPHGYYENTEIHILNDHLLLGDLAPIRQFRTVSPEKRSIPLRLVMTAFRIRYSLTGGRRAISRRADRHANDIRKLAENYQNVAIKDPRFSHTIGAWSRFVTIDRVLYSFRHPFEVARSLQARYSLPMWMGYRFWYGHVTSFFQQVKGVPIVMVNYENYFGEHPLDEVKRLYAFARRPYNPAEAESVLNKVLDPSLKRNVYSGAPLPRKIKETHERLRELHGLYTDIRPYDSGPITMSRAELFSDNGRNP